MDARVGDRIIVESQKAGTPPREGRILEVIESPTGTHLRVLWDDGHETTMWPHGGAMRFEHPKEAPPVQA